MQTPSTETIEATLALLPTTTVARTRICHLPRASRDALAYMARHGYVVLYAEDNGRELTAADQASAVRVAGTAMHLVYRA